MKAFIASGEHHSYSELSSIATDLESSPSQLTGTMFDDVVLLFSKLASNIEERMASHVLNTWRMKCGHYRNYKYVVKVLIMLSW